MVSNAQAASLGAVRATEAREALASFGVLHVWFLGGTDTPGQNVLQSLETWDRYLRRVETMESTPDAVPSKACLVRSAREMIRLIEASERNHGRKGQA